MFKLIRALAFVLWLAVTALDLYIELDPRFTVGVPVKLVGVGEGIDDLIDFDRASFLEALLPEQGGNE